RVGPRRGDKVVSFQIDDPDWPILAAAIIATLFVPRVVHAIGDMRSIGGNLALIGARQGQRFFDTAVDCDGPESRRPARRPRTAIRREADRSPVSRPAF